LTPRHESGSRVKQNVDLVIVHHGLFWPGLQRVTGVLRRQLELAFENNIALYSAHLPLDLHPQVGNNAQLAVALGLKSNQPFLRRKRSNDSAEGARFVAAR
jgi:putative NIF3 family GTP cyclohydrolase 1 type 2